jgi:hypothetical protein
MATVVNSLTSALALQRTYAACTSFEASQDLLRRAFDEDTVANMLEVLNSGDPLGHGMSFVFLILGDSHIWIVLNNIFCVVEVAARHIRLFVSQPEFVIDAEDQSLVGITFSLIRRPSCLLRLELILLLREMSENARTRPLLLRHHKLLISGFTYLTQLLRLPLVNDDNESLEGGVWREERAAILHILSNCLAAAHIRQLLSSLQFGFLSISSSTQSNDDNDFSTPLAQVLSKAEKTLFHSIVKQI